MDRSRARIRGLRVLSGLRTAVRVDACGLPINDPSRKTPIFVRFSTVVGFRGSADTVRDEESIETMIKQGDVLGFLDTASRPSAHTATETGTSSMYLSDRAGFLDRRLLRVLAGATVAVIVLAWFGSLAVEPSLLRANVFRVLGALVAAGIAWAIYRPGHGRSRQGLPWQRCLAAGVMGSLVVTGISILVPALGGFSFAGWLVSGIAGGAIVVLAGYAIRGGWSERSGGTEVPG